MLEKLKQTVNFLQQMYAEVPSIAIVLGSGLGDVVSVMDSPLVLGYNAIPHFLPTSIPGHLGKLYFGKIQNKSVLIFQGRVHAYEGHSIDQVVYSVRTAGMLGVKNLILTNAAGGIDQNFAPGDLALIEDHINLSGVNPLTGPNLDSLGPRFPDMTDAYSLELRKMLNSIAQREKIHLKSGIYAQMSGPSYETPAEIRMLKKMGASMVGMSTVPEVIVANHMGMRVAGISCISNFAAGLSPGKLSHEEIKHAAQLSLSSLKKLISEISKVI